MIERLLQGLAAARLRRPGQLISGIFDRPVSFGRRILRFTGRPGTCSVLFSWGKAAAVIVMLLVLFSPQTLEANFPGWRHSLGYVVLAVAAFALLANFFRSFGVIAASLFWLLVLFVVGQQLFVSKPAATVSTVQHSPRSGVRSSAVSEDAYAADAFQDKIPVRTSAKLPGNAAKSDSGFWGWLNPFKAVSRILGSLFDWGNTGLRSMSENSREILLEGQSKTEGFRSKYEELVDKIGEMLGLKQPELADSGLPDGVYYPKPYRKEPSVLDSFSE
jgi:hypothetical protein